MCERLSYGKKRVSTSIARPSLIPEDGIIPLTEKLIGLIFAIIDNLVIRRVREE